MSSSSKSEDPLAESTAEPSIHDPEADSLSLLRPGTYDPRERLAAESSDEDFSQPQFGANALQLPALSATLQLVGSLSDEQFDFGKHVPPVPTPISICKWHKGDSVHSVAPSLHIFVSFRDAPLLFRRKFSEQPRVSTQRTPSPAVCSKLSRIPSPSCQSSR